MSVLVLPDRPIPQSMRIGRVSAGNVLTPAFGGDDQQLLRKGTRYALTYRVTMSYLEFMDWNGLMSEGDTVLMRVFQPGFDTGAPGSSVVAGGGQSGTTLNATVTPHYAVRSGQFLNVVTGGQHFLYQAGGEAVADASGAIAIPLRTMLRRPPADGDQVNLSDPMVEGFVRDLDEGEVDGNWMVTLQFTVRERE